MCYKYVFPLVVLSCIVKAQLRQDVVCVMMISVVMKWLVFKGETKAHLDSMKLIMSYKSSYGLNEVGYKLTETH